MRHRLSVLSLFSVLAVSTLGGAASPAGTAAPFRGIAGLAADPRDGTLYLVDQERGRIYRVAPGGGVQPFAGGPAAGFDGDGRPALETAFHLPAAVSFDLRTGELFVADTYNYRVRAVRAVREAPPSPGGPAVRTVAGVGLPGVPAGELPYDPFTPEGLALGRFGGDGGPAAAAELNLPAGVAADPFGILFIADSGNHRVRAVNRGTSPVVLMGVEIGPGAIRTVAGTGVLGFSGDGGPAAAAQLAFPTGLAVDAMGNLILVDTFNQRVRKVDRQSGVIRTVARGALTGVTPERALESWSVSVAGVAVNAAQEILYTDRVDGSVHRLSRGGDDRVVFTLRPRDPGLGSVAVGPRDEIYTADVFLNRILRLEGGAAETYVAGQPNKTPPRPAASAAGH